jgi:hypothetical protein
MCRNESRLHYKAQPVNAVWGKQSLFIVRTIWNTQTHCVGRIYSNSVRTSQETHYITTTKHNRLMLFRETVAVYCEDYTELTDTLYGQNAEF